MLTAVTTDESEWASALGHALEQILAEQGQTRKGLARQIGVDPATVSRIVNGLQPTTVDQLAKIARALGVTRRSILTRAGYLNPDGASCIDLDSLTPMARAMVSAAVRAALELDSGE